MKDSFTLSAFSTVDWSRQLFFSRDKKFLSLHWRMSDAENIDRCVSLNEPERNKTGSWKASKCLFMNNQLLVLLLAKLLYFKSSFQPFAFLENKWSSIENAAQLKARCWLCNKNKNLWIFEFNLCNADERSQSEC